MKYAITLMLFLVTIQANSQETKPLYTFSILSPSIGIEKSMQENNSLKFSLNALSGYGNTSGFPNQIHFL